MVQHRSRLDRPATKPIPQEYAQVHARKTTCLILSHVILEMAAKGPERLVFRQSRLELFQERSVGA